MSTVNSKTYVNSLVAGLTTQNKDELIHVLENHVLAGQVLDLPELAKLKEVKTYAGEMLTITPAGNTLEVRNECLLLSWLQGLMFRWG